MSTISKEFTKEQLIEKLQHRISVASGFPDSEKAKMDLELARIALASLEAEPVCVIDQSNLDYLKSGSDADVWPASRAEMGDVLLYRSATPAPVSVPDAIHSQGEKSASDDYYALGWNACRAAMLKHSEPFIVTSDHRMMEMPQVEAINAVTAMLQGADGTLTNEGTIPVTQFKPVADLYGLTSPTGGETSFTFDAVEARDFIDGGWSCQEYVELGRFQEDVSGNSPVVPDGWVACSERMPEEGDDMIVFTDDIVMSGVSYSEKKGFYLQALGYDDDEPVDNVTHWMLLPAAPQQEVK